MRGARALLLCILLAGGAGGAAIVEPLGGWVFDARTRSIRPVLGIPGASRLGGPLALGFPLEGAVAARSQDYLIATGADGVVRVVWPAAGTSTAVDAPHGTPSLVILSPDGSAALFVNETTVDVYRGLPARPVLARSARLPDGGIGSLAVNNAGSAALAVAGGVLWMAGESAEWQALGPAAAGSRAAFSPSGDAVLADAGTVVVFRHPAMDRTPVSLHAPVDFDPVALAVTDDGRIVLAGGDAILVIDPATSSRLSVPSPCTPALLAPMGPFFRLNELSDGPLWLLDARPGEPRLLFVPAPPASGTAP